MSHPPQKSLLGSALTALERAEAALEANTRAAHTRVIAKQAELALYVRAEAAEAFGSVRAFAVALAEQMNVPERMEAAKRKTPLSVSTVRGGLTDQLRSDVLAAAVELIAETVQAHGRQPLPVAA